MAADGKKGKEFATSWNKIRTLATGMQRKSIPSYSLTYGKKML